MEIPRDLSTPSTEKLLEIIRVQTEIAQAPLDLGEIIEIVAKLAQSITEASGAVVELAEDTEMVYRAATGIAAAQLGLRIQRVGSLSGLCIDQGQVLYCSDSESDPRVNKKACRIIGLRSMIVVPLRYRTQTVGVLKVMNSLPNAFSDSDAKTLDLMSGLIAAGMAHASQYESQVEASQELLFRATYDTLTGLNNRASFYDHLRRAMASARRYTEVFGVAVLDMDGLKPINDHYGHHAGDAALRTLAARLKNACRASDVIARLGGDEFGIVIRQMADRQNTKDTGLQIAKKVAGRFPFEGQEFNLQTSVGVALYPDDGDEPDLLIKKADVMMYEMKRQRRASRRE